MDLTNAPVSMTLLFANIAISLWALYSNPIYFERFSIWPYQVVNQKRYYQIITSGFLHANFGHLFFNMFALFSFGVTLEMAFNDFYGYYYGSMYFFLIYMISLVCGSLFTILFHKKDPNYVAVGASGAISGIVFSYIIFFPTAQLLLFFVVPMPAYVFALLWIAFSIYGMKTRLGNIGHEAHLGGAIGGVIATLLLIDIAWEVLLGHFSNLM